MSDLSVQAQPNQVDPDDLDKNTSANPSLHDVLAARLHRRYLMKGGVGAMTMAGLGSLGLSACGGGDSDNTPAPTPAPTPTPSPSPIAAPTSLLGFKAVNKAQTDRITVPEGYTATVIYATGDSIDPSVPDYLNNGSQDNFARRSGDHHDGIEYFGLSATGAPARDSNTRALLALNHENIAGTVQFMHPSGQTNATAGARPEAEAVKEIEAHGVSIVEVTKTDGRFGVVKASTFNRRVTASTVMNLTGPASGSAFTRTVFSPAGTQTRGTINNCGHGYTPWGTYLAAEENWAGYFTRANDNAVRTQKDQSALLRNGIGTLANPVRTGSNRWSTVVPATAGGTDFSRWDITAAAALPADGTGDFRNAANTFGFIVEIDPYDPASVPAKRTALGRRANEGAWPSLAVVGRPLAFYIGCDSRGEYVYKFVSTKLWVAADANRADRMAVGAEYMDSGTIYAARFNPNGTGTWVKLDLSNPDVAAGVPVSTQNPAGYAFSGLDDICVNTRLAADAAKATRMDRPEWTSVNPKNGEIYITMTENPDRGNTAGTSNNNFVNPDVDAANPRYYVDNKAITAQNAAAQTNRGNVNGHIVRIREDADTAAATTFKWDIFLFGAQARADVGIDDVNYQANVNLSGLSDFNDLSKPDGCWFSRVSGILWIETDDNSYYDVTNAMLLAAIPGVHGDGAQLVVSNKPAGSPNTSVSVDKNVTTYMGKKMTDLTFKRFLTAPKGAEVTGVAESPDGKTLFINIQHPGENTTAAQFTTGIFESNWPGNGSGVAAYGPGGASARPRSATLMITKDDGGVIGL
jgi:uncharacterized protein